MQGCFNVRKPRINIFKLLKKLCFSYFFPVSQNLFFNISIEIFLKCRGQLEIASCLFTLFPKSEGPLGQEQTP